VAHPVLLGLPYDSSSSFLRGAAAAPPLIREALHSPAGNPWSERNGPAVGEGLLDDAGDLTLTDGAQARALIEREVRLLAGEGRAPILLGGDHSVTYPILCAMGPLHRKLTVLHIDAHPDLYDEFGGDRYSHACPFARVMDVSHREPGGLSVRDVLVLLHSLNGPIVGADIVEYNPAQDVSGLTARVRPPDPVAPQRCLR
jgi:arginase family enzyme